MKLNISRQQSYSRGELLLRTIFGVIYIGIPHGFLLIFVGIWSGILAFATFWVALFTGKFPQGIFEFQVKFVNWTLRLDASLTNLVDGYPAIGIGGTSESVNLEVPYPESVSRGKVLLRALFGALYVGIPHGFVLVFRIWWGEILAFVAWWIVLFTGDYPEQMHAYQVGTLRWSTRLTLYLGYFNDDYPPFSGKE